MKLTTVEDNGYCDSFECKYKGAGDERCAICAFAQITWYGVLCTHDGEDARDEEGEV